MLLQELGKVNLILNRKWF